jgi:hypothetical protein
MHLINLIYILTAKAPLPLLPPPPPLPLILATPPSWHPMFLKFNYSLYRHHHQGYNQICYFQKTKSSSLLFGKFHGHSNQIFSPFTYERLETETNRANFTKRKIRTLTKRS